MAQVTVYITSGSSWQIPIDCNLIDFLDCIGAAGSGAGANTLSNSWVSGGAGGAFSRNTGFSVTPGGILYFQVGIGGAGRTTIGQGSAGTDSWVNKSGYAAPTSVADGILAKGGGAGIQGAGATASFPIGGQASQGIGMIRFSGGHGGYANAGGATGGGGAAGPNGDGLDGVTGGGATSSGGGSGDQGLGGPGSAATSAVAGGDGTEWDATSGATRGSGGGSGGTYGLATVSGRGGLYGGGSGACVCSYVGGTINIGVGGSGLIRIVYTPAVASGGNMPMLGM